MKITELNVTLYPESCLNTRTESLSLINCYEKEEWYFVFVCCLQNTRLKVLKIKEKKKRSEKPPIFGGFLFLKETGFL